MFASIPLCSNCSLEIAHSRVDWHNACASFMDGCKENVLIVTTPCVFYSFVRRMWEEEEAAAAAAAEEGGGGGGGGAEDPAEVLERLARVMGGWGSDTSLRQWQSGRLDPFGQSGSENWFRWVGERGRGI